MMTAPGAVVMVVTGMVVKMEVPAGVSVKAMAVVMVVLSAVQLQTAVAGVAWGSALMNMASSPEQTARSQ